MTTFGDSEPEDAWHPDDAVPVLLDNLCRRCGILGEPRQLPGDATDADWLAELRERVQRIQARRDTLTDDEKLRLAMIVEDVEHVAQRIGQ